MMKAHFVCSQRTMYVVMILLLIIVCLGCQRKREDTSIDRHALVTRHNVLLHAVDTLGTLSVGNGEFTFTVDASGLQTFPNEYDNGIPPGTFSQWGWHTIPSSQRYTLQDVAQPFESCDGSMHAYAIQRKDGRAGEATAWLRENPHRMPLGLIGLVLLTADGKEVSLTDLKNLDQRLDLWTGKIETHYEIEGVPVTVKVYGHTQRDQVGVEITSELIRKGRLKLKLDFPYGADCHVCAGTSWNAPERHMSQWIAKSDHGGWIHRVMDSTHYFVDVDWQGPAVIQETAKHHFEVAPSASDSWQVSVSFRRDSVYTPPDNFSAIANNSVSGWKQFWESGGAIDFSACTDPRASELERRVVLSQYLTRIQCAGSMPPQETGLTMNSWYGKFHLEMYWWHAAHFALWNRADLMEPGMQWYKDVIEPARKTAQWQGYSGARWQKMTDPYGNESPSSVGAFIIWQQPHPIYLAELLYRANPTTETLQKYKDVVFETAEFMASFLVHKDNQYHLCHPLIPAQEIFKATETDDPAYELQYWYYALSLAQQWHTRLGMPEDENWNKILSQLAPLPVRDNLYLPNATTPEAYHDDVFRRDHPAVVGAYGFLPYNSRMDTVFMRHTFENIMSRWQWDTTWGWDYPLLAMTAARLNLPEQALNALLMDVTKNTYLINGHNYQDKRLRLYLPGNGGLLAAVAMMAGGWDGSEGDHPGFPKDGKWNIRSEGLQKMP